MPAPEERRDANDLARAAIERLRNDNAQRTPEPAHAPEVARNPEAPRIATAPAIRPLPPPIMVSTPSTDNFDPAKPPWGFDFGANFIMRQGYGEPFFRRFHTANGNFRSGDFVPPPI